MTRLTRLIALGFAIGSAVHAVSGALLWQGVALYGPRYPAWRHAVMALTDASIASVAWRYPRWLVFALSAFAAEQLVVNGLGVIPIVILVVAVFAGYEKWRRPPGL